MPFAIVTAKDYREKMDDDLKILMSKIDNSSYAINAATSAYHVHEWLWAHILKGMSPVDIDGSFIRSKSDFVSWLEANCPYFSLVQDLTNGSKHAYPVKFGSGHVGGYGVGPYGIGPFGAPYLLVDLGVNAPGQRYLVASEVIREAAEFMRGFAARFGA